MTNPEKTTVTLNLFQGLFEPGVSQEMLKQVQHDERMELRHLNLFQGLFEPGVSQEMLKQVQHDEPRKNHRHPEFISGSFHITKKLILLSLIHHRIKHASRNNI